MRLRLVTASALALALAFVHRPSSEQALNVESHVGAPLRLARIGGHLTLVYELHLTNVSDMPLELAALDVLDGSGKSHLHLGQESLGGHADLGGGTTLATHERAAVFLTVDFDDVAPTAIQHRLVVRQGETERVIATPDVVVEARTGPVIGPPLRCGPWVAVYNDTWARGHRRVFFATAGHTHLPGRFAIDWMRVDQDGRTLRDESGLTSSSFSYGAEVLAVADARVVSMREDVTEAARIADNQTHPHPDAAGNFISLALKGGRYATYEHLRPGTLKVRVGDEVRAGQVLAEVGFSGDSTEPHLHFHVSDSAMPLEGEGIPFGLSRFEVIGRINDWRAFGQRRWDEVPHRIVMSEFPRGGDVIEFIPEKPPSNHGVARANHAHDSCNESHSAAIEAGNVTEDMLLNLADLSGEVDVTSPGLVSSRYQQSTRKPS